MGDAQTGWQKLDKTVDCMKTGDVKCVQETLNTVQDQKLFMDLLGSKAESKGLPGLQIVDGDKDGHTDAVKVTAGKNQMSIDLKGGNLSVTDNSPTLRKTISGLIDKAAEGLSDAAMTVRNASGITDVKDSLSRAGTSDSDRNRAVDSHVKRNGG